MRAGVGDGGDGDGVCLVLHGASGLPADMVWRAMRQGGVCKFNVNTEVREALLQALARRLAPSSSSGKGVEVLELMREGRSAMQAVVHDKMNLFKGPPPS